MQNDKLKIKEIFYSLQGESSFVGLPTTFIRLTGCPLRCNYCDSAYAFHGGENLAINEIINKVKSYPTKRICVTGGEPLAQKLCKSLIKELLDQSFTVSIETSGAINIADVDQRACLVMDLKTPGSGETTKNLWDNIKYLKSTDQIKFVICSQDDFSWAIQTIKKYDILQSIECLVSPCFGKVSYKDLAEWVLNSGFNLRLQVQLHKLIWGDKPGH